MGGPAGVIGAGTMGSGVAYVLAVGGYATHVVEPSPERQAHARTLLTDVAADGVRRGRLTPEGADAAMDRLIFTGSVDDLPQGCEVVVENVPERFELKVEVLQAAEAREPLVLASNTSALSIDALGKTVTAPERFLGMHFFNPVWSIGLVELVQGAATAETTVQAARTVVDRLGKEAALVRDSPGFATSRLDLVAGLEAMRMVQDGVASAEDIDRAMRVAYRHPVGPLYLSDVVGLDVRLDIARNLAQELGSHFEPPQILLEMVERGDLGQKSGRGFYTWS